MADISSFKTINKHFIIRFNRLRSILCLSKPENAKCDSYYGRVSCATAHIEYLPREHVVVLPVGLMLLMQEIYDEHSEFMDHHSRVCFLYEQRNHNYMFSSKNSCPLYVASFDKPSKSE